jgi:hypothetical protein
MSGHESGSQGGVTSSTETADGCYEQSRDHAERDSGGQARKQPASADRKARDTYRQASHHSANMGKGRGHLSCLRAFVPSVDGPILIQTSLMRGPS